MDGWSGRQASPKQGQAHFLVVARSAARQGWCVRARARKGPRPQERKGNANGSTQRRGTVQGRGLEDLRSISSFSGPPHVPPWTPSHTCLTALMLNDTTNKSVHMDLGLGLASNKYQCHVPTATRYVEERANFFGASLQWLIRRTGPCQCQWPCTLRVVTMWVSEQLRVLNGSFSHLIMNRLWFAGCFFTTTTSSGTASTIIIR